MEQVKLEITAEIKCPYCNYDNVDYCYPIYLRFDGNSFDLIEFSPLFSTTYYKLEKEGMLKDEDYLILGSCDNCGKTFKIGLYSYDVQNYKSPIEAVSRHRQLKRFRKFEVRVLTISSV